LWVLVVVAVHMVVVAEAHFMKPIQRLLPLVSLFPRRLERVAREGPQLPGLMARHPLSMASTLMVAGVGPVCLIQLGQQANLTRRTYPLPLRPTLAAQVVVQLHE
jgi:hypothetical protein